MFTDPKEGVGIYRVEHGTHLGEDRSIRSKHFRNVKKNFFLYALVFKSIAGIFGIWVTFPSLHTEQKIDHFLGKFEPLL